ncbi:AbrB/MazE/SpoVT family DNA-binding domain-containing protein [Ralstonia solanacearum]|uniref:AbrB/MazE/SpoVT family DNA-binding domain-containing protein n=1 Tax=Ralstonia solanacearum TaxID=305 RepID=UPI0005ACA2E9|nr:AbrB/MazE/SpoVT family DNA-binding domain-containing protein [Ralstonia solanacearum]MDC6177158.1 AbrB/MazE/SpoVT family DNA-binding domain-containing protein [Ralstonia solanacearum]MDC6238309.1 AbrB/MazE/SpoVT family DNA-binding domain-containing protein [Ralstonia solanacearum]
MASATLTSKGQVTIPVDVRTHLGLSTGDRIEFILNEQTGGYEVVPATRSVTALKGIIRKPAKPVSIEDMNAAIADQGATAR